MRASLASALTAGAEEIGLALPGAARDRLIAYVELLTKWNATYNLTAIRDPAQMVSNHLLDSLSVARLLRPGLVLDVGSGGGLPGIPLAIYAATGLPALAITVLDSNHKKAAFLRQAKIELKLDNLEVCGERVESWRPSRLFGQIVSRAFSELHEFFNLTRALATPDCQWLAMKGVHPHEEIVQLPATCTLEQVHRLRVPGLAAERHVVVLRAANA